MPTSSGVRPRDSAWARRSRDHHLRHSVTMRVHKIRSRQVVPHLIGVGDKAGAKGFQVPCRCAQLSTDPAWPPANLRHRRPFDHPPAPQLLQASGPALKRTRTASRAPDRSSLATGAVVQPGRNHVTPRSQTARFIPSATGTGSVQGFVCCGCALPKPAALLRCRGGVSTVRTNRPSWSMEFGRSAVSQMNPAKKAQRKDRGDRHGFGAHLGSFFGGGEGFLKQHSIAPSGLGARPVLQPADFGEIGRGKQLEAGWIVRVDLGMQSPEQQDFTCVVHGCLEGPASRPFAAVGRNPPGCRFPPAGAVPKIHRGPLRPLACPSPR